MNPTSYGLLQASASSAVVFLLLACLLLNHDPFAPFQKNRIMCTTTTTTRHHHHHLINTPTNNITTMLQVLHHPIQTVIETKHYWLQYELLKSIHIMKNRLYTCNLTHTVHSTSPMRLVLFSSLLTCGSAFVSGPSCERKVSQSSLFVMDLPSAVPSDAASLVISNIQTSSSLSNPNTNLSFNIANGIRDFLVPPANAAEAPKPPTNDEIKLLRSALGALYGERNPQKAEELITNAISAWERQAPDERAALYRVRADCFMVR